MAVFSAWSERLSGIFISEGDEKIIAVDEHNLTGLYYENDWYGGESNESALFSNGEKLINFVNK